MTSKELCRTGSRGRWLTACTALAVAMAVAVPPGAALEVAKQRATLNAQSFGAALAACPKGRTAVSGGFAAPGFDPASGPTIGRLGFRHSGKGAIRARGYNFGAVSGDLVSYAYCVLHDHGFRISSASVEVEPQTLGSAVASCPAGTQAVAGGFDASRTSPAERPGIITLTSMRVGKRRWKVAGVNIPPDSGQGSAHTLTAYAYCEAAPFELTPVSRDVTTMDLKTFQVRCPNGGRAFSGGFDGQVELAPSPSGTAAVTSRRASRGRAWRTSALSVFDSSPATATAYAYCRS